VNNNINNNFKTNWIPVVTYNNPHLDKFKFYTDIVKKSGIYISVNNIYNKSYIGTPISLSKYYIYLLKPQYNNLKIADIRLGSKYTEQTKNNISNSNKGINHNFYGKIHTYETRNKISHTLKSIL